MTNAFNSGPTAPERNPPIEPQYFQPSAFPIAALSLGTTTTVTTTPVFGVDNNYVVGQLVKFLVPQFYGTSELNNQVGYVIALPATNQVTVDLNSTGYTAFNASPTYGPTLPQILAIGDINSGSINTGRTNNGTTIAGSFINISPL